MEELHEVQLVAVSAQLRQLELQGKHILPEIKDFVSHSRIHLPGKEEELMYPTEHERQFAAATKHSAQLKSHD